MRKEAEELDCLTSDSSFTEKSMYNLENAEGFDKKMDDHNGEGGKPLSLDMIADKREGFQDVCSRCGRSKLSDHASEAPLPTKDGDLKGVVGKVKEKEKAENAADSKKNTEVVKEIKLQNEETRLK